MSYQNHVGFPTPLLHGLMQIFCPLEHWFYSKIQENGYTFAWIHHMQLLFSLAEEHLSWKIEFCIHKNVIQAGEVPVMHSDTITTVQKEKLPFKKVPIFVKDSIMIPSQHRSK